MVSLPLSCVIGTFRYQIKSLEDGWTGFRIDNRTDLASGTHVATKFPSEGASTSQSSRFV
jgi:flagellin-like hook-associated protein FlgL